MFHNDARLGTISIDQRLWCIVIRRFGCDQCHICTKSRNGRLRFTTTGILVFCHRYRMLDRTHSHATETVLPISLYWVILCNRSGICLRGMVKKLLVEMFLDDGTRKWNRSVVGRLIDFNTNNHTGHNVGENIIHRFCNSFAGRSGIGHVCWFWARLRDVGTANSTRVIRSWLVLGCSMDNGYHIP